MKTMEGLVGDVCVNLMQTEAVPSNNGLPRWEYSTALFFAMTTLTTIGEKQERSLTIDPADMAPNG